MIWWQDPKVIVFLIGVAVNAILFAIIKFNDLYHLGIKVNDLVEEQKKMNKEQKAQGERIAKIEGKLEAYED